MRYKIIKFLCQFFPPLLACYLRELLYPFKYAIIDNISFKRNSITGSTFEGNTSDIHSYWFGIHGFFDWRNLLIAKVATDIRKSGDIIEIGANIGTETIGFADIVGIYGSVHAFEPLSPNLDELKKITKNNKKLNITLYPHALSNKHGTLNFLLPPSNYSGIGKIVLNNNDFNPEFVKVDVLLLDDFISKFKDVSSIFIDTEGHELLVLMGAKQTINKHKPMVVIEVSESLLAENNCSSKELLLFFKENNYKCYNLGRFLISEVHDDNYHKFKRHANWVCIPALESKINIKLIKKSLYKHIFLPLNNL